MLRIVRQSKDQLAASCQWRSYPQLPCLTHLTDT
jgi:hypothetical protein